MSRFSANESVPVREPNIGGFCDVSMMCDSSHEPPLKKLKGLVVEENIVKLLKSRIEGLKMIPADFDPSSVVWWDVRDGLPFLFLCLAFDLMLDNPRIIDKMYIICNMLGTVIKTSPDDLVAVMYLQQNKVASAHQDMKLRPVEKATVIRAMAEAYGQTEAHIRHQCKMKGDLDLVAKECVASPNTVRHPAVLTVAQVFETLQNIAKGPKQDTPYTEEELITALLVAAIDSEPQYLIRLVQCKLRVGMTENYHLAALGQAAMYHESHSKPPPDIHSPLEEAARVVKQVYRVTPDYDKIITALLMNGLWNLTKTCSLTVGIPVQPMLLMPTRSVSEKYHDMAHICEYNYDGEWVQIHFTEGGSVAMYSHTGERITGRYPDVSETVLRLKKQSVTSFVLDCVIVAYDRATNRNMPSQVLRACNYEVCIYAFDIMFQNGQSLIEEQLQVRMQCLYKSFEEEPGYFQFAKSTMANNPEGIHQFLEAASDDGCHGIIIKPLITGATYEPSNRWLELRKDYINRSVARLNLVPIGAFHGFGKRAGVYGSFLLACYNPVKDEFQSICKIGTGFKKEELEERFDVMRSTEIQNPKPNYRCGETIKPDVWFDTTEVWEVEGATLTLSAAYEAAFGVFAPTKGICLTFPRVLHIFKDKNPREATSTSEVANIYSARI